MRRDAAAHAVARRVRSGGHHHAVAELADPATDLEGLTLEAARRGERVRQAGALSNDF